jgi:hypothetical protein
MGVAVGLASTILVAPQSVSPDVFGGTPNTAGQRPALPIPTESFRLKPYADELRKAAPELAKYLRVP